VSRPRRRGAVRRAQPVLHGEDGGLGTVADVELLDDHETQRARELRGVTEPIRRRAICAISGNGQPPCVHPSQPNVRQVPTMELPFVVLGVIWAREGAMGLTVRGSLATVCHF
jgi:hypothetical protein